MVEYNRTGNASTQGSCSPRSPHTAIKGEEVTTKTKERVFKDVPCN